MLLLMFGFWPFFIVLFVLAPLLFAWMAWNLFGICNPRLRLVIFALCAWATGNCGRLPLRRRSIGCTPGQWSPWRPVRKGSGRPP